MLSPFVRVTCIAVVYLVPALVYTSDVLLDAVTTVRNRNLDIFNVLRLAFDHERILVATLRLLSHLFIGLFTLPDK